MDLDMALPLDAGFMRRQCPHCEREFKWRYGPTEDRPEDAIDPPFYYCPYCGTPAGPDAWWTEAQLAHAQQLVDDQAMRTVNEELQRMAMGLRGSAVKMTVTPGPEPGLPTPLIEPTDMMVVASPCHPWEPIKILEDWTQPIHCLICGQPFALS